MTAYLIHTETNPTFTRIARYVPGEGGIQVTEEES